MALCPSCGHDLGAQPRAVCPYCSALLVTDPPAPSDPPSPSAAPATLCPNCHTPMNRSGELEFRVGGRAGGSGFLLGNWNQLSEQLQPFSVYHCPQCGRVDLYEPGR